MTLATELEAVTDGVRQQAPAEVFAAMEAANVRLASSGVVAAALRPGDLMPD